MLRVITRQPTIEGRRDGQTVSGDAPQKYQKTRSTMLLLLLLLKEVKSAFVPWSASSPQGVVRLLLLAMLC